jgi:hypothetical protein
MATRSTIAVEHQDGTVSSIYCHWDGYPSWNGKILLENYNNIDAVEQLVALGAISVLGERLEPTPEEAEEHTYDHAVKGVTVFYHRDRDEDLDVDTFENLEDYSRGNDSQGYDYIFSEGQWYVNGKSLKYVLNYYDDPDDLEE